jgi:hypothetical protein
MKNPPTVWDARCLMCEALVGQVVSGKFVHNPNCSLPLRVGEGRLRCCRCGGTLYREPASELMAPAMSGEQVRAVNLSKYGR